MIVRGKSVQIVYGGEQEVIKPYMRELLAAMRKEQAAAIPNGQSQKLNKF